MRTKQKRKHLEKRLARKIIIRDKITVYMLLAFIRNWIWFTFSSSLSLVECCSQVLLLRLISSLSERKPRSFTIGLVSFFIFSRRENLFP